MDELEPVLVENPDINFWVLVFPQVGHGIWSDFAEPRTISSKTVLQLVH